MTTTVNMLEGKTSPPELVRPVESGAQPEIVIARAGRPAARVVPPARPQADRSRRIGVARGRFEAPEPDPVLDAAVEHLLETGGG